MILLFKIKYRKMKCPKIKALIYSFKVWAGDTRACEKNKR